MWDVSEFYTQNRGTLNWSLVWIISVLSYHLRMLIALYSYFYYIYVYYTGKSKRMYLNNLKEANSAKWIMFHLKLKYWDLQEDIRFLRERCQHMQLSGHAVPHEQYKKVECEYKGQTSSIISSSALTFTSFASLAAAARISLLNETYWGQMRLCVYTGNLVKGLAHYTPSINESQHCEDCYC